MTYLGRRKPWEAAKAQLFLKLRLISRFLFFFFFSFLPWNLVASVVCLTWTVFLPALRNPPITATL